MTINNTEIQKMVFAEYGHSGNATYTPVAISEIIQMSIRLTEVTEQTRIINLLNDEDNMMATDIGDVLDKPKLIDKIRTD